MKKKIESKNKVLLSIFMPTVWFLRRLSWVVLTDARQKPNAGVNIAVLQTQVLQESVPSKPPGINPCVWNTQSRANTSLSPCYLLLHSMAHCSRPERERKKQIKTSRGKCSKDSKSLLCHPVQLFLGGGNHVGCISEQQEKRAGCLKWIRKSFRGREIKFSKYIHGWRAIGLAAGDPHGPAVVLGVIFGVTHGGRVLQLSSSGACLRELVISLSLWVRKCFCWLKFPADLHLLSR